MEPIWALGLMSGTSLDGIDAALVLTDGERIYEIGESLYLPYESQFQELLRTQLGRRFPDPSVAQASTQLHIEAVHKLLNMTTKPIKLIGYHGQTTFHAPPITVQMGEGATLAQATGVPVVYDFRTADCQAGGQGAPLVPVYHQALCAGQAQPLVLINIGGVANLTYINDNILIAGDTGPGNALINDVMSRDFSRCFDEDGLIALTSTVNQEVLARWLQHPYFAQPFPKSLDRNHFRPFIEELQGAEAVATLTALTASSILGALKLLPQLPHKLYICGGGAKNKTLMHWLGPHVESLPNSDMIEAQAFAFLAVRVLRGLPTSFPMTTGCEKPVCGGQIVYP